MNDAPGWRFFRPEMEVVNEIGGEFFDEKSLLWGWEKN